jgi:hypothetical protein
MEISVVRIDVSKNLDQAKYQVQNASFPIPKSLKGLAKGTFIACSLKNEVGFHRGHVNDNHETVPIAWVEDALLELFLL